MAQFRVFAPRMRPHVIMAHDLDEAERVANKKYPNWTDIYIVKLSKPVKNVVVSLTHEEEALSL